MKKMILLLALSLPLFLYAQIGIKGGLNFANVSKASSINSSSRSGFHVGIFLAPGKGIIGSRTELMFSRQGYDYKKGVNTGSVNLDYIQMGQLMSINITKYFSLMFGAQTSYLISAQVDSTANGSGGTSGENQLLSLYNRVDYGYAVGAEVHPVLGLIIGVRYNVSLAKIYKDIQTGQRPSFTSEDAKNNVVQISVGWRFGNYGKEKKKEKE